MKEKLHRYRHAWVLLYFLIYLPWFVWLESRAHLPYHVIHMWLDDYIPFVEFFVVPYFLWFVYVGTVFLYLFFHDKKEFYRYCAYLFTGMTLFLIISTVWPNGHLLRPTTFTRDNIFINLVQFLYSADTSTNIFPSIHVYNSIAAHMAVLNCKSLRENKAVRAGSLVLMVSIILSTIFLKQHSLFDVLGGIALGAFMNQVVYHLNTEELNERAKYRRAEKKFVGFN